MGFIIRRTKRLGDNTDLNVQYPGASMPRRVVHRLRHNSRRGGSFRILRGLSRRFRRPRLTNPAAYER
jgi:hypothetical protein